MEPVHKTSFEYDASTQDKIQCIKEKVDELVVIINQIIANKEQQV